MVIQCLDGFRNGEFTPQDVIFPSERNYTGSSTLISQECSLLQRAIPDSQQQDSALCVKMFLWAIFP